MVRPGILARISVVGLGILASISVVGPGILTRISVVGPGILTRISVVGPGILARISVVGSGILASISVVGSGILARISVVGSGIWTVFLSFHRFIVLLILKIKLQRENGKLILFVLIFPISVPILIFLFVKRRDNQNVLSASQQKWQNALRVIFLVLV